MKADSERQLDKRFSARFQDTVNFAGSLKRVADMLKHLLCQNKVHGVGVEWQAGGGSHEIDAGARLDFQIFDSWIEFGFACPDIQHHRIVRIRL